MRPSYTRRRHGGFLREHGPAVFTLIATLLVVVLAGSTIAERVGESLRRDSVVAPLDATRPTPDTTTAPGSLALVAPPESETAPLAPVVKIQTVPAMSDVLFEVGDRRIATDASGSLSLSSSDAGAVVRFIGPVATPPIQTVDLARWGDGSTATARPLDTIEGPVAEVGLEIASRVLVETPGSTAPGGVATFRSAVGPVEIPIGDPVWVLAAVVRETRDGLSSEALTYELTELTPGAARNGQVFVPTPEATWRITS